MISKRIVFLAAGVAVWFVVGGDRAAGQTRSWVGELPTVEQVKKSTPAGKDGRDTLLRQSAALVVWQDVIEAFMKKSFFDMLNADRSAPEVKRYFEYSAASTVDNQQGHAVDGVIAYSDTFPFRQEVLARFLSASTLNAYWELRRANLEARQARHKAFAAQRASATTLLDHLPSVAQVKQDMAGSGERDSAARAWAALQILAVVAEPVYNGRSKAAEYSDAASLGKHSDRCKNDPGCTGDPGENSPFYFCRNYYWTSPAFIRAVLDKYVPLAQQSTIRNTAHAAAWDEAMSMPPGSVKDFPAPITACTAERYSIADEDARLKAVAAQKRAEQIQQKLKDEIAAIQERKKAKADADADAKRRALADGARARDKHVDADVFRLPLGVPAPAPDCESVGHWQSNADPDGKARVHLDDLTMVSSKTCLLLNEDGTTHVHWGDDVLPGWAELVETDFRADVLVAVRVTIPARPRPPTETIGVGVIAGLVAAMSNGAANSQYERMLKEGPANVAEAYKELSRKYKNPIQPVITAHYGNRTVDEPEWRLPGLHVKYDAGPYEDTIVIELQSVADARAEAERKKHGKL